MKPTHNWAILYSTAMIAMSVFFLQPVSPASAACATYDSANNTITVSCDTTLPQVVKDIDNPSIIENKGDGEYIVKATLQINDSKLTISSDDGVSWVKFTGGNGLYYYHSKADISGVKITSWDESANAPIDNKGAAARAWVRFYKISDTTIRNSEFAYLGYGGETLYKRGISFEGAPAKNSTNVHIDNVEFHHNHYAFFSSYLSDSDLKNSNFHDNDKYDIDPHSGTHDFLIANNHIHDSQAPIGIICSLDCNHVTIDGNTVEDSQTAITLSRNMHDSIVRNNQLFNVRTGISVTESSNNEIHDNTIHDVSRGIYFVNPSAPDDGVTQNNNAHDNHISKTTYGIIASRAKDNIVAHNKFDSSSTSYEYFMTYDSKLTIDDQKFSNDKVRGANGTNTAEIHDSGFVSMDEGSAIDTSTRPYTANLTSKVITVDSAT
jgi:parallel beta-helix repeat protein